MSPITGIPTWNLRQSSEISPEHYCRNALTYLRAILPALATFYAVTEEGPCLVVNRDSTTSLTGHGIVSQ